MICKPICWFLNIKTIYTIVCMFTFTLESLTQYISAFNVRPACHHHQQLCWVIVEYTQYTIENTKGSPQARSNSTYTEYGPKINEHQQWSFKFLSFFLLQQFIILVVMSLLCNINYRACTLRNILSDIPETQKIYMSEHGIFIISKIRRLT